jgi:hypothetical protein
MWSCDEQHEVGACSRCEVADVLSAKRERAPAGRGVQSLRGSQMHLAHGERDDQRDRHDVGGAGVAVGREGNRDTGIEQAARVRVVRAGRELRARQQRGDHVGVGKRRDVVIGEVRAVVHARGTELGGDLRAGPVVELVAVQTREQARPNPCRENCAGLLGGEGPGIAEDVDPACERSARGEHVAADQVDVGGAVVRVLGGDDVCAQVGGLRGELAGDVENPLFCGDLEAVAALDLDGGGALGDRLGEAGGAGRAQLLARGRAGRCYRGHDSAAGVGLAGHARGELGRAIAGEHEVRVRVHESGDDGASGSVDALVGGRRDLRGPRPRDQPVLDYQRRVTHHAEKPVVVGLRVAGDQLPDVVYERRGHDASPSCIGTRTSRSLATSTARS